jgi:hypothetical protein
MILAIITIAIMTSLSILKSYNWYNYVAPTTGVLYGFLIWIFDNLLWKLRWITNATKLPDLSGHWVGRIEREGEAPYEITLIITQTFTRISLVFCGRHSKSYSMSSDIEVDNPNNIQLRWVYYSEPTVTVDTQNKYGEGCTRLAYSDKEGKKSLEGIYYSMKLRRGTIRLVRR